MILILETLHFEAVVTLFPIYVMYLMKCFFWCIVAWLGNSISYDATISSSLFFHIEQLTDQLNMKFQQSWVPPIDEK